MALSHCTCTVSLTTANNAAQSLVISRGLVACRVPQKAGFGLTPCNNNMVLEGELKLLRKTLHCWKADQITKDDILKMGWKESSMVLHELQPATAQYNLPV